MGKSNDKETVHAHKKSLHAHFYDSLLENYSHPRRRVEDHSSIPRKICSSCGSDPSCLMRQDPDEANIQDGLKYILLAMKVLGLTHNRKVGRRLTKSLVYSLLLVILLWGNFTGFFYVYAQTWKFGTQLFYRITMHIWFGQLALTQTIYFFQVSPMLATFIRRWNDFAYNHHCQTARQAGLHTKKAMLVGLLFCFVFMLIFTIFGIVNVDNQLTSNHYLINDILNIKGSYIWLNVVIIILQVLFICIWTLPIIFLYAVSATLSFNFRRITCLIADLLRHPDTMQMGKGIEMLRNRHQMLCRVVKDLDGMYSVCMLSVYVTCIPVICLATYNLTFNAYGGMSMVVYEALVMFISILLQMGLVTSSVSTLTLAANSPTEELFDFQIVENHGDIHRNAFQVSIFIQRITHCHIGLTAWNLFNVNKQSVFMMTTMILSYVFVLFKLGLSLEMKDAPGNTNETMH